MTRPAYPTRDSLVAAWIAMTRSATGEAAHEDNFWSFSYLNDLVRDHPAEAFEVIKHILAADTSNEVLPQLAAGPVEDMLNRHGEACIPWFEAEAGRDPMFRRMLGGVWKSHIPVDVWSKVEAIWDRRGWDGIPE